MHGVTFTPREFSALEAMAQGASNPEVHRRVVAVIAYRDALDSTSRPVSLTTPENPNRL